MSQFVFPYLNYITSIKMMAVVLLHVRLNHSVLLPRLTKRAAASLRVKPGLELWVQVKSVALMGSKQD